MKTITGDSKVLAQALNYIESLVNKKAIVKRINNNGVEILMISNIDTLSPDVGYMVHVDVVAAKDDQCQLTRRGDMLFGRGTSDMKFSIHLGIALLNDLLERESDLSFTFVVTTDEEVGGDNVARYLAREVKFRPKVLIVPDGGDLHGDNEWLGLSSTLKFYDALKLFINTLENDRMILNASSRTYSQGL